MNLPRLVLAPLLLLGTASSPAPTAEPATVVLVVRHAERAPGSGDVPISPAGMTRAEAVRELGRAAGVQVIIHTQFLRTRQTAAPLAESLGLTPIVVATGADVATHIAEVAAAVRQQSGRTVLVVGHSNTVPGVVGALGGPKLPDLCDAEYDVLFTLVLDEQGTRVVRSRFGEPTPATGPGCNAMR